MPFPRSEVDHEPLTRKRLRLHEHGPPTGELPALRYFEGFKGYGKPNEPIQNNVFYLQL